ncbi:unnamed protein product [Mytilus coruscus]|uniref:Uncharacterized protein n=1 Tax=Mytilus coruscus TaxID=42192 RepID=A0A6J8ACN9_MYTCO|nr:unnamed protein product [Mytilus coruscus]
MLILDEEGQVDTALPIDVTFVEYVCVGPGRIYYTDWYRKSVHCIDMTGEEIFRLKYNKMKYPLGITLNRDGTVFVVGRDSHNVLHVSADGHQREVILGKQHDLTYPRDYYRFYVNPFNNMTGQSTECSTVSAAHSAWKRQGDSILHDCLECRDFAPTFVTIT